MLIFVLSDLVCEWEIEERDWFRWTWRSSLMRRRWTSNCCSSQNFLVWPSSLTSISSRSSSTSGCRFQKVIDWYASFRFGIWTLLHCVIWGLSLACFYSLRWYICIYTCEWRMMIWNHMWCWKGWGIIRDYQATVCR